ncbi:hypothetical protein [Dermacoccus nishinomiyaensis]|uniref:hypothetical protein n=1 Tax=Dermacoccus nishinomiyaensis TaxID=1274 RepID=UPI0012376F90|nr:hypothetical protein [Dermacoccus nishinomiyaensis]
MTVAIAHRLHEGEGVHGSERPLGDELTHDVHRVAGGDPLPIGVLCCFSIVGDPPRSPEFFSCLDQHECHRLAEVLGGFGLSPSKHDTAGAKDGCSPLSSL